MEKEEYFGIIFSESLEIMLKYEQSLTQKLKSMYIQNIKDLKTIYREQIKRDQGNIIGIKYSELISKEISNMSLDGLKEYNTKFQKLVQLHEKNINIEKYIDLFEEKIEVCKELHDALYTIDYLYIVSHYISIQCDSNIHTECIISIRELNKEKNLRNERIEKITREMNNYISFKGCNHSYC